MNHDKKILQVLPILIVLYFILILYNRNIDELASKDLFTVFIVFLSIITIFSLIPKLIIKNYTTYILILSILVVLFFSYISIHDFLFKYEIFGHSIGSHKILAPLILGLSILGFYLLSKSRINFDKITVIFTGIVCTLIIFTIIQIGIISNIEPLSKYTSDQVFTLEQKDLRNIYFIILDEYAGTESLMKKFNYDNSGFENFLKRNGFFIPENTFSNYIETRLVLPSLLNMNYVNLDTESKREQDMIIQKITRNNIVMNNFKKMGYEIIYFHNELNVKPIESTENRLCDSAFTNTFLVFIIQNTPLIIFNNIMDPLNNQQYLENRLCVFDELLSLAGGSSHPIMVHAHIMMPHQPVLFDSKGNTVLDKKLHDNPFKYVEQLQYTNSRVKPIVEKLLEQEPKPIIIILSDHGYRWDFNWKDPTNDQFLIPYSNFMAFYFPERELRSEDFQVMTPVNTYRILFNTYFGTNYELLENKMYYRDNYYTDMKGIPIMKDVTDLILNNSRFGNK